MSKKYRFLPPLVLNLLTLFEGWIIGSGAFWFLGEVEQFPGDLDIMISPEKFNDACKLLKGQKINVGSFGALTFTTDNIKIDLIPMSIEEWTKRNTARKPQMAVRLVPKTILRYDLRE